jgi:hypothetical protein
LPLTIAAGLNSPLLLAKLALGHEIGPADKFQDELIMLRFWEEIFVSRSGNLQPSSSEKKRM